MEDDIVQYGARDKLTRQDKRQIAIYFFVVVSGEVSFARGPLSHFITFRIHDILPSDTSNLGQ